MYDYKVGDTAYVANRASRRQDWGRFGIITKVVPTLYECPKDVRYLVNLDCGELGRILRYFYGFELMSGDEKALLDAVTEINLCPEAIL